MSEVKSSEAGASLKIAAPGTPALVPLHERGDLQVLRRMFAGVCQEYMEGTQVRKLNANQRREVSFFTHLAHNVQLHSHLISFVPARTPSADPA